MGIKVKTIVLLLSLLPPLQAQVAESDEIDKLAFVKVKELPPFEFSFFDPDLHQYRTLKQPAIALIVHPNPETTAPQSEGEIPRNEDSNASRQENVEKAPSLDPDQPIILIEKDQEQLFFRAVNLGEAEAQFELGLKYLASNGASEDAIEAVKWFRRAADQGSTEAQYVLGEMYANGEGVPKDEAEAVKWYRKAADQGFASAQYNLGGMYAFGMGVPKDEVEAVKWYRKAADQGFAIAQVNLGVAYANGRGVPKDEAEAVKWYRKAADQGAANAQYNLGWMYDNGRGVSKDEVEAVEWYRKAADQGSTDAQRRLDVMRANSRGVPKDEAVAQRTTREIYNENKGAVVLILAYDSGNMPSALGSGFYIETNKIASNFHVVEDASRLLFRVIGSDETHEVKRITSVSKALDLAILEVEQQGPPVSIAPLSKVGVGDKVVAIGNPRGLEGSVSEGIVSAIRGSEDIKILQITAPISPGSSGGPLFSADGEVIGVTTATLKDSQSLNFAVPASLLTMLRDKGKEWEPIVANSMPTPQKGNAGVQLVSPDFDNPHANNFQFSILNNNERAINNVFYLLIFKDQKTGNVLHFIPRFAKDTFPAGLGLRFDIKDRATKGFMLKNRRPYSLGDGNVSALVDVEIKVLTYDFVGDIPGSDIFDVLQK